MNFSNYQLDCIWNILARRFKDANVDGISLGIAEKNGELDGSRSLTVQVHVKRKLVNPKTGKVPKRVRITIPCRHVSFVQPKQKQQKHAFELTLPTDVVQSAKFVACGELIVKERLADDPTFVTTGIVTRWKILDNSNVVRTHFGVISIAHAFFADLPLVLPGEKDVEIVTRTGRLIPGRRILQTDPRLGMKGIDACLIEVSGEKLIEAGLIESFGQPSLPMITTNQLLNPDFQLGLASNSKEEFVFTRTAIHQHKQVGGVGLVHDLVEVKADRGDFEKGTSGTLFQILYGEPNRAFVAAAIQVGADSATFSKGLGQSLDSVITRLRAKMNQILDLQGKSLVDGKIEVVAII